MPFAAPTNISIIRAHNQTEGGSFNIEACLNNLDAMQKLKERHEQCMVSGGTIKFMKQDCGADFLTGSGKFCNHCGANQAVEEARSITMIMKKK